MSNYTYENGAIHHDHHKEMTINVSGKTDIAALMRAFMTEDAEETSFVETPVEPVLPEVLLSPQAKTLLSKLRTAGMLDEDLQPVGLSNAEKGTLAEYIAERLDITNKWKFFGNLWQTDSETLRTSKARGLDQDKTWKFREQLEAL